MLSLKDNKCRLKKRSLELGEVSGEFFRQKEHWALQRRTPWPSYSCIFHACQTSTTWMMLPAQDVSWHPWDTVALVSVCFPGQAWENTSWTVVLEQGIPAVASSVWGLSFWMMGFSQDGDFSWWNLALKTLSPFLSQCRVTHFSVMALIYNDRYLAI